MVHPFIDFVSRRERFVTLMMVILLLLLLCRRQSYRMQNGNGMTGDWPKFKWCGDMDMSLIMWLHQCLVFAVRTNPLLEQFKWFAITIFFFNFRFCHRLAIGGPLWNIVTTTVTANTTYSKNSTPQNTMTSSAPPSLPHHCLRVHVLLLDSFSLRLEAPTLFVYDHSGLFVFWVEKIFNEIGRKARRSTFRDSYQIIALKLHYVVHVWRQWHHRHRLLAAVITFIRRSLRLRSGPHIKWR